MQRIRHQSEAEDIAYVLGCIPEPFRSWAACADYFCADPVFAGLYGATETDDGRSYRGISHVTYPWHQNLSASRRRITVVYRAERDDKLWVLLHEMGHVVDYFTNFSHTAEPVSDYAATDRQEAFAEAFCATFQPRYSEIAPDAATRAFFDSCV